MKIIFFGTPEFAVASLKILHENGFPVAAVVTAPDKKSGRGLQLRASAVKEYAIQHKLDVLQPEKLNDNTFISQLELIGADLFVIVAFRMLPEKVWTMPPLGTFNLHASLLPHYRGAAPINRAIMNGEQETGVTTFFLRHEIDTGNIIDRESVSIGNNETAGELHDRLMAIGASLVLKTVRAIQDGTVTETPQSAFTVSGEKLKTAPKIFSSDCQINWTTTAVRVHNQVRGLSPFPGAFTYIETHPGSRLMLKIYRSVITGIHAGEKPGTVTITGNKLYVACADELIEITEMQLEGKKRLDSAAFLAGFRKDKHWYCITAN